MLWAHPQLGLLNNQESQRRLDIILVEGQLGLCSVEHTQQCVVLANQFRVGDGLVLLLGLVVPHKRSRCHQRATQAPQLCLCALPATASTGHAAGGATEGLVALTPSLNALGDLYAMRGRCLRACQCLHMT